MSIEISLPFGNKENVKNLVFSILTSEYPLKLISLTNFIRKRYGRSVTFQAVRKATLQLVNEGILLREGNNFLINKDWVGNSKAILDELYLKLNKRESQKTIESIGGNVTVFTFSS